MATWRDKDIDTILGPEKSWRSSVGLLLIVAFIMFMIWAASRIHYPEIYSVRFTVEECPENHNYIDLIFSLPENYSRYIKDSLKCEIVWDKYPSGQYGAVIITLPVQIKEINGNLLFVQMRVPAVMIEGEESLSFSIMDTGTISIYINENSFLSYLTKSVFKTNKI